MSITIYLTPGEEAQLSGVAQQNGVSPQDFAAQAVRSRLSSAAGIDAKLRLWQEQDGTGLMPSRAVADIFAQWDKDASAMTEADRRAEDAFWEDFHVSRAEIPAKHAAGPAQC